MGLGHSPGGQEAFSGPRWGGQRPGGMPPISWSSLVREPGGIRSRAVCCPHASVVESEHLYLSLWGGGWFRCCAVEFGGGGSLCLDPSRSAGAGSAELSPLDVGGEWDLEMAVRGPRLLLRTGCQFKRFLFPLLGLRFPASRLPVSDAGRGRVCLVGRALGALVPGNIPALALGGSGLTRSSQVAPEGVFVGTRRLSSRSDGPAAAARPSERTRCSGTREVPVRPERGLLSPSLPCRPGTPTEPTVQQGPGPGPPAPVGSPAL